MHNSEPPPTLPPSGNPPVCTLHPFRPDAHPVFTRCPLQPVPSYRPPCSAFPQTHISLHLPSSSDLRFCATCAHGPTLPFSSSVFPSVPLCSQCQLRQALAPCAPTCKTPISIVALLPPALADSVTYTWGGRHTSGALQSNRITVGEHTCSLPPHERRLGLACRRRRGAHLSAPAACSIGTSSPHPCSVATPGPSLQPPTFAPAILRAANTHRESCPSTSVAEFGGSLQALPGRQVRQREQAQHA